MKKNTLCMAIAFLTITACSSISKVSKTSAKNQHLINEINKYVGLMNMDNCQTSTGDLRAYIRTLDFRKNAMDQELQSHLFQMRLNIKNIYVEGVKRDSTSPCIFAAKQTLSDLRTLEEILGFHQSPGVFDRNVASVKGIANEKNINNDFAQSSVFTDSHKQLVTNGHNSEDSVTSLMDLKTGDILLLHRVSQDLKVASSPDVMNWTDIVVVYRDSADDLFLLTTEGEKVRLRTWRQTNNWLKRNVDRLQILRPKVAGDIVNAVEKMQNRKLKNMYSFGDLIKKELKLKTSNTSIPGVGSAVLGEDLEMSPDLMILSEWKDYSAAYRSRTLTQFSKSTLSTSIPEDLRVPNSPSLSRSRVFCESLDSVR
ncbi:MAG: hypothetical protein IT287_08300 [Bdellovibrionaceae bacterium]|nr:hypothetical protein [Pseudobdellovibrionaceae bacterium]